MKVGSSLDSQIWYEPYHAKEFKLFMKTDLFKSFLMNFILIFRGEEFNICLLVGIKVLRDKW